MLLNVKLQICFCVFLWHLHFHRSCDGGKESWDSLLPCRMIRDDVKLVFFFFSLVDGAESRLLSHFGTHTVGSHEMMCRIFFFLVFNISYI